MARFRFALVLLTALVIAGCGSDDEDDTARVPDTDEPCDFSAGPRDCPPTVLNCTGAPQTYVVPAGVYGILVDVRGAYGYAPINDDHQALGGLGGAGGRVITTLDVEPGQQLDIYVGCAGNLRDGGWGHGRGGRGGAAGRFGVDGGGGGGSSAIVSNDEVLVVAGGGGGGGGNDNDGSAGVAPQVGTWGGDGGFGTNPATAGEDGQCDGVGCPIASGGCANCSGGVDGGDGDSMSSASDFGGGGGGGGGGYFGGNGGDAARADLLRSDATGSSAGANPCQGNCPIDVGEAGGGGGGQSYAVSDAAIFLPNVYGRDGQVVIHTTAASVQLISCAPNEPAMEITVPQSATHFDVELVGGAGHTPDWGNKYRPVWANGQGGFGGVVTATIPVGDGGVNVGDTLVALAGCQGQGSGGFGWGSGGEHGHSSDDFGQDGGGGGGGSAIGYRDLTQPLVVAGGGGGGGGSQEGAGGAGGNGATPSDPSINGHSGNSADGDGGDGGCGGCNGDADTPFDGTDGHHVDIGGGGGGGGGGWPGGAGGNAGHGGGGGGGGGGASGVDSSRTTNVTYGISNATGDGYVLIFQYPGPPASIVPVSGSGQSAAPGFPFPQPLVARVTNNLHVPMAGVPVAFNLSGDGAASGVFPDGSQYATVTTDSNGLATSPPVAAAVALGPWQAGAFVEGLDVGALYDLTNVQVETRLELSVSPQPVTPNQVTTVTASVVPVSSPADIEPTGNVTITIQGAPYVYPLVDGKAEVQFQPGNLALGSSTIEAHYPGEGPFSESSGSLPLDVVATPTSMTLTSSANPAIPGQEIVFTATIAVPPGTVPCAGCTVTFTVNGAVIATVPVDSHWQASTPYSLAPDVYTIGAELVGGPAYAGSSATLQQLVGVQLVLGTNATTSYYGAALTLIGTVAVPPNGPAPTGTVTFTTGSGAVRCADVPLAAHAECDLGNALPAGTYAYAAHYSGDSNYPALSTTAQVTIHPTQTTTTVTAPARVGPDGQPFKISAQVDRVQPGTLPLSGTVQFYLGGDPLGDPVPIDASGNTGLSEVSTLPGTYVLSATYSGTSEGYLTSEGEKTIEVEGE